MISSPRAQPEQPARTQAGSAIIEFNRVRKRYGEHVRAVQDVSFSLVAGQVLALLGPSGCGKSTTLRLLAGLETPDSGAIYLDGICVAGDRTWVPPEGRRVGLVFQDYALFPHLTVRENLAFPLQHLPKTQRAARLDAMAELVGMAGLLGRYPHEISGGQQQRVALARALAPDPSVVLLDEPFSNLDAALRENTRAEVRAILARTETTTILVTHDQEEAFSFADTVAVMFDGRLEQIGPPEEIYLRPATRAVATFVGTAHFVLGDADGERVRCVLGELPLARPAYGPVVVLLRPDALTLTHDPNGGARITQRRFFGPYQLVGVILADGTPVTVRLAPHVAVRAGDACQIQVSGPVMAYPR